MLPALDARALRGGSRDLGALAERCRALALQLQHGGQALTSGPRSWSGVAARAGGDRAAALLTALGRADRATTEAAVVLGAVATAVEDAQSTWESSERLATGGAQGAEVSRAAGALAGEAEGRVRAATASASAVFDELAGRAPALCQAIGRDGAFAKAVEVRTHGPISAWDDVRDGLAAGVKDLVQGGVQTAVLAWPLYWVVRPGDTRRRVAETAAGSVAALRDPAAAVRQQLGTDDLENGHAWRFWSRLVPQAALAAVAKGAGSFARAAGAVEEVAGLAAPSGSARLPSGVVPVAGTAKGRVPPRGSTPLGFADPAEFGRFGAQLGAGLRQAGYGDVRAAFQGSSVTGRDYLSGAPFDVGRRSDFDVALGGRSLFERARSIGVELRSGGTRTAPLTDAQLREMGLKALSNALARLTGRPIGFMVYQSIEAAALRRPSIIVPLR